MKIVTGLEVLDIFECGMPIILMHVQGMPNWQGVLRRQILEELARMPFYISHAAHSNQISKVRDIEAQLTAIRSLLRTAKHPKVYALSPKAEKTILNLLKPVNDKMTEWKEEINAARGRDARFNKGVKATG